MLSFSYDQGGNFETIDMGWTFPSTNWFGGATHSCAGASYHNWMQEVQEVNWCKIPVGTAQPAPATWMWFDTNSNLPVRLMFGQGPPSPLMGDPQQLAFFPDSNGFRGY